MAQGKRAIRIANCSGANPDPGYKMLEQATSGPVDAITGDYLAEFNLSTNSKAFRAKTHKGWEPTCEDGLMQTLSIANEKGIKIVVNGGALNPRGLAELVHEEVKKNQYSLKIAYVEGDDLLPRIPEIFSKNKFVHLDSVNDDVQVDALTKRFQSKEGRTELISAHAYLGSRAISAGLRAGADIIICGRVADASPVIGLASWWHSWSDTDFDALAGSLIAGHLVECASYSTGSNFCGFVDYPIEDLVPLAYPICEIEADGTFTLTKHENLKGFVNVDTARSQLLYELQGNIYLNSDVTADIEEISMVQQGTNRVRVFGVKGSPPPPTTKLAIFYDGGYQMEVYMAATGTAEEVEKKFALHKAQVEWAINRRKIRDQIDILDFQLLGVPEKNPRSQVRGTAICRMVAQANDENICLQVFQAQTEMSMQHYHGMHKSLDVRSAFPRPVLAYYPALVEQSFLDEKVILVESNKAISAGHISKSQKLPPRLDYETKEPKSLETFGPTKSVELGKVAYARSGDKGSNANVGFFVHTDEEYDWLCSALTKKKLVELLGDDYEDSFFIERIEMRNILSVHFVVYGILGRGVSSTTRLDCFGKGLADYLRSKYMDIPQKFLKETNGHINGFANRA